MELQLIAAGKVVHEYFSSPVLLHPALHRCADFLERRQRVVGLISQASLANDTHKQIGR
jgi:hypothetical protein